MKTKQSLQGEPDVIRDYKTKVALVAAILTNRADQPGNFAVLVSRARELLDEVDIQVDAELSETPGKAGL